VFSAESTSLGKVNSEPSKMEKERPEIVYQDEEITEYDEYIMIGD
jgi:hypothetical protein